MLGRLSSKHLDNTEITSDLFRLCKAFDPVCWVYMYTKTTTKKETSEQIWSSIYKYCIGIYSILIKTKWFQNKFFKRRKNKNRKKWKQFFFGRTWAQSCENYSKYKWRNKHSWKEYTICNDPLLLFRELHIKYCFFLKKRA